MSELKALIFDVDGTLAETERDGHRIAFNLAFRDDSLDWHWSVDLYRYLLTVGGGKERIQFFLDQYHPEIPIQFDPSTDIQRIHANKNQHYHRLIRQGKIDLRLGVQQLIHEAKAADIKLAIATTSSYSNAIALLEKTLGTEAIDWFSVIAAGDIVSHKKPAPDIYHYVLNCLKLPSSSCLVFEDSGQGVCAALAANLTTIMTINTYTKDDWKDLGIGDRTLIVVDQIGDPMHPFNQLAGPTVEHSTYVNLEMCRHVLNLYSRG